MDTWRTTPAALGLALVLGTAGCSSATEVAESESASAAETHGGELARAEPPPLIGYVYGPVIDIAPYLPGAGSALHGGQRGDPRFAYEKPSALEGDLGERRAPEHFPYDDGSGIYGGDGIYGDEGTYDSRRNGGRAPAEPPFGQKSPY